MKPKTASSSSSSSKGTPSPSLPGQASIMDQILALNSQLPQYWFVHVIIPLFWLILYLVGWLKYLILWYVACLFISPHASWETTTHLAKRCLRPFKHYPWYFGITPLGIILSRVFLIYPFDTFLYCLDEIFFRGYKKTEVKNPFLILGQPRSGTTKFESVLEEDKDLLCLRMYEIRWPYLSFQYGVDAVCYLDANYLNGAIEKFFRDYKLLHCFDEGNNQERATMRRLRYDMSDEDDAMFLFHHLLHFQLMGAFPDPELTHYLHYFEELSLLERERMLRFHRTAVQKVLYRRGQGKRYFGKWVLSWCGVVQESFKAYPDMKILVMVRDTESQLRSWFKLQNALSKDLAGFKILDVSPEVLEEAKKINCAFHKKELAFVQALEKDRVFLMDFNSFYKDIQGNTRRIYEFLGKDIVEGSHFDKFLKEQTHQQLTHKATETDARYITSEEIRRDFPNLMETFFPKEGKSD